MTRFESIRKRLESPGWLPGLMLDEEDVKALLDVWERAAQHWLDVEQAMNYGDFEMPIHRMAALERDHTALRDALAPLLLETKS